MDAGEFTLVGMSPFSQDSQQKIVCIKCRSYCLTVSVAVPALFFETGTFNANE